MAKISRIDKGPPPSSTVPQGALLGVGAGAAPLTEALGTLAGIGYKIAAGEEHEEALKVRRAREAKQVITNAINVNRIAGNYEEDLVAQVREIEKTNWETPELIPEQVLTWGRQAADRYINAASNTDISLGVAQKTNARLDSTMRGVHDRAQRRQTQKAKGDLSISINRAVKGAEEKLSLAELDGYIVETERELVPLLHAGLDPKEAIKMWEKARVDMTRGWAFSRGIQEPLLVLEAVESASGPIADYLSLDERKTLHRETLTAWKGLWVTKELDAIQNGTSKNSRLTAAFMAADPNFAGIAFDQKRALDEQELALGAHLEFDNAVLKKLGIDIRADQSAERIREIIDDQQAFISALEKVHRRRTPFYAVDDPTSGAALLFQMNEALKSKNGRDLGAISKFQRALAIELAASRISGASASTMVKTMALAMDKATGNAMDPAGINAIRAWLNPRIAGNMELNRQFEMKADIDKTVQYRIRMRYTELVNQEEEIAGQLTGERAVELAIRALSLELGVRIPGGGG